MRMSRQAWGTVCVLCHGLWGHWGSSRIAGAHLVTGAEWRERGVRRARRERSHESLQMPEVKSVKQGEDMIKCMFCKDHSGSCSIKGGREKKHRKSEQYFRHKRGLRIDLRKGQWG